MDHVLGRIAQKVGIPHGAAAESLKDIEALLSEHVHEHGEAPLGKKGGIIPATKSGDTQKLYVREKLFAHSAIADKVFSHAKCKVAFKVVGKELTVSGKAGNEKNRVIVCSREGDVLAVIQKSIHLSTQKYYIFGSEPILAGQRPSDEHLGRQALYTLGTARKADKKPFMLSFDMVRRGGGGPQGDAYTVENLPADGLLSQKPVLIRKMGEPAALLWRGHFIDSIDGPVWDGTVAPGIDPIAVLGLIAILDELHV